MDTCCQSIIKYLIFLFNLIFALTGLALTSLGATLYIGANSYLDLPATSSSSYSNYINASIFFIVIGVIIFTISFLGCCGSLVESKCMIYAYATLISAVVLAEVIVVIFVYSMMAEIPQQMKTSMANYGKPGYEGVKADWDFLQQNLTCCGVTNYRDWEDSLPAKDWEDNLPTSCCDNKLASCSVSNVYNEGCLGKVDTFWTVMVITTMVIISLQVIIISFSFWIGHQSGKKEDKEYLIERY